jgi:hypothetical protein
MKPNSIVLSDELMFVLDDGGHGRDCHSLTTFDAAKQQLDRWRETHTFDYDEAIILLVEFFKKEPAATEVTAKLERIVEHLLNIPTLRCRGTPDLDFHMVHTLELRLILRAAYEVGRASVS